MKRALLNCEVDSPEMDGRIALAAAAYFGFDVDEVETIFEHGQWWVRLPDREDDHERLYSVNDASGGHSVDGFCFEEIG